MKETYRGNVNRFSNMSTMVIYDELLLNKKGAIMLKRYRIAKVTALTGPEKAYASRTPPLLD
jgi:hypothetical protein